MSKMFQSFLTTDGISDIASGDVGAFRSWIQNSSTSVTEPHSDGRQSSTSTVHVDIVPSPAGHED